MTYFVYMLIGKKGSKYNSYIGYTKNLVNRLNKHNSNKGAKFTKGNKWKIIFKKKFLKKNKAMGYEYYLKKNKKLRNSIKLRFLKKCFQ